jgi:hypothetical protein
VPAAAAQRYGRPPVKLSNEARKIAADRAGLAAPAVRADVPRRAISRILAGQPVNAGTYLRVCGTLGIDSVTGESRPPAGGFDIQWWAFASGIKMTRMLHKLSTCRTASLIKVSAATISRAEAGRPISAESYLALRAFIGISIAPDGTVTVYQGEPLAPPVAPTQNAPPSKWAE